MSLFPNTTLQNGVDYSSPSREGSVNPTAPKQIDSIPFGSNVAANTVLKYGAFVVRDTDGGAKLPVSGTSTVANIAGVIAYLNNGVMQDGGLKKGGVYAKVPVLVFGRIVAPVTASASLVPGDVVSLNLAAGANFNTVRPLPGSPASSDLDISSIAKVARASANGMVELTIKQYIS